MRFTQKIFIFSYLMQTKKQETLRTKNRPRREKLCVYVWAEPEPFHNLFRKRKSCPLIEKESPVKYCSIYELQIFDRVEKTDENIKILNMQIFRRNFFPFFPSVQKKNY